MQSVLFRLASPVVVLGVGCSSLPRTVFLSADAPQYGLFLCMAFPVWGFRGGAAGSFCVVLMGMYVRFCGCRPAGLQGVGLLGHLGCGAAVLSDSANSFPGWFYPLGSGGGFCVVHILLMLSTFSLLQLP